MISLLCQHIKRLQQLSDWSKPAPSNPSVWACLDRSGRASSRWLAKPSLTSIWVSGGTGFHGAKAQTYCLMWHNLPAVGDTALWLDGEKVTVGWIGYPKVATLTQLRARRPVRDAR